MAIATGKTVPQAWEQIGGPGPYYRRRREYGGMRADQAKRPKDLERENGRLKRRLAAAELDKAILREAAPGKF